jgi:hypothetical protein
MVGRGGVVVLKTRNMITINHGVVGTLVFRNEGDGCLNAKYMNEDEHAETSVLQPRTLVIRNLQVIV